MRASMSPERRVRTEEVGAPVTSLYMHQGGTCTFLDVVIIMKNGAFDVQAA
jgi:hypothetical protein